MARAYPPRVTAGAQGARPAADPGSGEDQGGHAQRRAVGREVPEGPLPEHEEQGPEGAEAHQRGHRGGAEDETRGDPAEALVEGRREEARGWRRR